MESRVDLRLLARARREQEHISGEKEAIRLHVDHNLGVAAISELINSNRPTVLRWLKNCGVYKGRLVRCGRKAYGDEKMPPVAVVWRDERLNRAQVHSFSSQRDAFCIEWDGVEKWDNCNHWLRHPERMKHKSMINWATGYKNRCLKKPGYRSIKSPEFKQRSAWRTEWRGTQIWDESRHWENHPLKGKYNHKKSEIKFRLNNHKYKMSQYLSKRMHSAIKSAMAKKTMRSSHMCGCSWPEVVAHLESQLKPGMTWENYGPY